MTPTALPLALYPALAHVRPSMAELNPGLVPTQVPADTTLFSENDPCRGFPLVLEGEVKVSRSSADGRRLELYRVVPGELSLASSASLFRAQPLSAHGITTQPTTLLTILGDIFKRWLDATEFRHEVLGLFAERMADLTSLVDVLAFHRLDQRLAAALLGRGGLLQISHQQLADELGTVREMVTRVLRRFEREGWVRLGCEQIHVNSGAALRRVATG